MAGRVPSVSESDDSRLSAPSRASKHSTRSSASRVPFPDAPPLPGAGASSARPPSVGASPDAAVVAAEPVAVPSTPLVDSILCRSTFAALEHSAGTLKRLSKSVLGSTRAVLSLLEQLEAAEDELQADLGELGRWLEGGYDVKGELWVHGGIRKFAREKRAREREELEVMVAHNLEAVKGEIKRQGLAGHGASSKFETVAKTYYAQTASYLNNGGESDASQAARAAQFDLMRYNHHSTLLYAVPPSSVGCLDLLVGLYGWVGAVLSQSPGKRADTHPQPREEDFARLRLADDGGPETPTQRGRQLAVSETPVRIAARDDAGARGSAEFLSRTLALNLAHLVQVRGDLLRGWAERERQTTLLEENARKLSDIAGEPLAVPPMPEMPPIPRDGKPRKKIGGKIRGLFGSTAPSALAERAPPVSSGSMLPPPLPTGRRSVDLGRKSMDSRRFGSSPPVPASSGSVYLEGSRARHRASLAVDKPFALDDMSLPSSSGSSSKAKVLAETQAKLNGAGGVGGVGGLDGTGDEDEKRAQVGRKKEGVLWSTGAWEELNKGGSRGRWERFWVVLAHSNIYEYRDGAGGKPESNATVIDLKFASVREGRGTDRRFVFEIVTPSHGRRLYQATSEGDMRTWIYAICNAIESSINGTSTVRASDRKYMAETAARDEEQKLKDRRLSAPAPKHKSTPVDRRSMPPPAKEAREMSAPAPRKRKTSLKYKLKHGAEVASDRISNAVSSKRASVDLERPAFLAQGGRMPSYNSSSASHRRASWYDDGDSEIEKRVYEMAGLGGERDRSVTSGPSTEPNPSPQPEARRVIPTPSPVPIPVPSPSPSKALDMALLREIASTGANQRCADCGRPNKSSRWATLSLRDVPMVMFLCIRCVGLHRGLGTHISRPRSVDMDNWTEDAIRLAQQWGNERGNRMWERAKPASLVPTDDDIAEFIKAKYVDGRWLSDSDRPLFGLSKHESVGRAI